MLASPIFGRNTVADIITEIQSRQARDREQEIATAQHDLDWNATFGRMAPDNVLRETRNMTALIANAVEKKMQLAAQTNAEAQRIYINDQKWKAEQAMQPLKDERLKAQIRADEARARATAAQELLATSKLEKEARAIEHTASAQWELDQLEGSSLPEAEKRAWLNTVRGKYPAMGKDAVDRYESIHSVLNPNTAANDEKIRLAAETTRAREKVKQEFATPPKTDAERIAFEVERKKALDAAVPKPAATAETDSYDAFNKDLKAAKAAYANAGGLPSFIQKAFEARGKQLEAQTTGQTATASTAAPAAATPAASRIERAKLALDDPEATPDEKAAARRILGQ